MILEVGKDTMTVQCESCRKKRIIKKQYRPLHRTEHPCAQCSVDARELVPWNKGKRLPEKKPGRDKSYIDSHGYRQIWRGRDHERDDRKDGYILEHRYVVEQHLGRKLDRTEIVHHIDGDKLNNDIRNLVVMPSISAHRELHGQLEQIAFTLMKQGYIEFDHETTQYKIKESLKCEEQQ